MMERYINRAEIKLLVIALVAAFLTKILADSITGNVVNIFDLSPVMDLTPHPIVSAFVQQCISWMEYFFILGLWMIGLVVLFWFNKGTRATAKLLMIYGTSGVLACSALTYMLISTSLNHLLYGAIIGFGLFSSMWIISGETS